MTLTLLLDLDDTLLSNSMESFAPAYFQCLAGRMAPYAEPSQLIKALLASTTNMVRNPYPNRTLEETFDAEFYPALGLKKEQVRSTIEAFYAEEFPKLQSLTAPRPEAVALVKEAFRRGYRVGIATNPLFPRTAILQRLTWANLSPSAYSFHLIPSYETFHFAKPGAAYTAEFLAQMGWPEGPVLMVGDDFQNDVSSALRAGIPTYWVTSPNTAYPAESATPTGRGPLDGLLPWIDASSLELLTPEFSSPEALLAILRSTPAAFQTLSTGLATTRWIYRPAPREWSLTEIACHLRDAEVEVNLPRIRQVLNEENPFLPAKDTDAWSEERGYIHQDGLQALRAFTSARIELLTLLDNLLPADWQRPARHAIFGPTRLFELVSIIAEHDRLHVRQLHQQLD